MDELKMINQQIKKIFFELVFAILLFIIALFLWLSPNKSLSRFLISETNSKNIVSLEEIKPLNLINIYPISDEDGINSDTNAILRIKNNSKTNSRYILSYRVNNNSTLDISYLKYHVIDEELNKVDFLSNLGKNKEENYTDYVISTGELAPNDEKNIDFNMWLDSNVGNEAQGKSLSANFVIISYNTELTLK